MTCRLISDASQWSDLLAHVPYPHVTQGFAYGEGKRANGWNVARIAFELRGRVAAICQIQEWWIAGFHLASRISRGPLFFDPAPDAETITSIYRQLRNGWGRILTGPLLITPALPSSQENEELLQHIGYRRRHAVGWHSAQIDLRPSEQEIFRGFSSTFRNLSRRAEKQDLTLEVTNNPEAIDWLIQNYSDRMNALGVKHGDHTFFSALAAAAGSEFFILRAMLNGEPVGGTALIQAGRVSEYNVAWHDPSARSLNVGHYLIWNAIREAKRRGALVFDVGGLAGVESGFSTFKRALHGQEYQLLDEYISI